MRSVVLLLGFVLAGCSAASRDEGECCRSTTAARTSAGPIVIDAKLADIGRSYRENEVKADRDWKGKRVRMSVTPLAVMKNKDKEPTLALHSGYWAAANEIDAAVVMSSSGAESVAEVKVGVPVTVEATCEGKRVVGSGFLLTFWDGRLLR